MNDPRDFVILIMFTVIGVASSFLMFFSLRRRCISLQVEDLAGLIDAEQVEMDYVQESAESGPYFVIRSSSARISYASWTAEEGKRGEGFTVYVWGKVGFTIVFVDEEVETFTRIGFPPIEAVFAPQDHSHALAFLREVRGHVGRFLQPQERVTAS